MPSILSDGISIHFEVRGSGPPLILLMGLGAPGSRWADHAAAYEQHFRCILIDNRGAGASDQPAGPYTTRLMADDTARVMQSLGIEQARVAGLSMGSGIAQELAIAYPNLVRSLVLISSWARCDAYTQAVFDHFKKMRALASPADFVQLLQLWIASPHYYDENLAKLAQDQASAADGYMPLAPFAAQCDACRSHNTLDRLPAISAPALLTVGELDIFTPLRLSAEMHARLPGSKLLIFDGCGHIHHWEDLERFNDQTLQFLLDH
ncbi:MAG: alpha/beta hydrolase [Anaerolineales bacterium]